MTYLVTPADAVAAATTRAAEAYSRSGDLVDPAQLADQLADVAAKLAATFTQFWMSARVGQSHTLTFPVAAVTDALALAAALAAALDLPPTDTARDIVARLTTTTATTPAGDAHRLHLLVGHHDKVALTMPDGVAAAAHRAAHRSEGTEHDVTAVVDASGFYERTGMRVLAELPVPDADRDPLITLLREHLDRLRNGTL